MHIISEYPELVQKSLKHFCLDIHKIEASLPLFKWSWTRGSLKLQFVCHHRLNIAKFLFEIIYRWLLPGRRIDVSSLFSTDFHFTEMSQTLFTMAEMTIRLEPTLSREQIEHNLKVIETEIRLGVASVYHASCLLDTHFTSPQQKNSQIQEKVARLLERNPDHIDYDIFGLLQQFMVMNREEFKVHRSATHLSRVVAACYLFMRSIEKAREIKSDVRHVRLKLGSVALDLPWGPKDVLGVCVGLNLLSKEEGFEEEHLIKALQKGILELKVVPESCYFYEGPTKEVMFFYLEVEKESGDAFSTEEIKRLKHVLSDEIQRSIEVSSKSLFMPRNEEEILKYIVALSGELRFVKDLPQVVLMFDEKRGGELYFTVIVVRILFPTSYSIQYLFGQADTPLKFIPDRVKRVGLLRRRYPKEATIFRVHISSQVGDLSIDLLRSRQWVFQELQRILGELRDYTGGLIAKQVELMDDIQQLMGEKNRLLELFFQAIYPVEARSFLHPEQVKNWFMLWQQLLEFPEDKIKIERDQSCVYVIGEASVIPELSPADFGETQLIFVKPEHHKKYLGYLFTSADIDEQQSFISLTGCGGSL